MQTQPDSARQTAAHLIEQQREALLEGWIEAIVRLFRDHDDQAIIPEDLLREDAAKYIELLLDILLERPSDEKVEDLLEWVTNGTQYFVGIEDIIGALHWLEGRLEREVHETVPAEDQLETFEPVREIVREHIRCAVERFRVHTAKHQDAIKHRSREMLSCWKLVKELQGVRDLEDIFRRSLAPLKQVTGFEHYRVLLFDEDGSIYETFSEGFSGPAPEVYASDEAAPLPVFQWCMHRRELYVCSEVTGDEKIANASVLQENDTRSFACYVLVASQSIVGALLMASERPRSLTISQTGVLQELCGVVAQSFERVLAEEHAAKRQAELEIVGRIGRALLEVTNQREILNAVATTLQRFKGFFDVCLFRVDREAGECVLVASAGAYAHLLPEDYRQPVGEGLVGLAALQGETILSNDARNDPRRVVMFEWGEVVKSELVIPILAREGVIGVMHFESEHVNAFDRRDLRALEAVATHIGAALQNAMLIEERERSRYEIEAAYRDMEMIMSSADAGITAIDHQGTITRWSRSCEHIFGYEAEEVVGRLNLLDLAAEPFDLERKLAECRRLGQMTLDRPIRHKHGDIRWIHETRVPVHDAQGNHTGYCSYVVDITEQHESETRLRQERDKLDLAIGAMGAGLALLDKNCRLQLANQKMMEWFGFDESQIGRPCQEVMQCGKEICEHCVVRSSAGLTRQMQKVLIRQDMDGVSHYYQTIFTPVDHGETQILVLVTDVTSQVQRTEQLSLIRRLGNTMQQTLELDKVLHIILTCVTFGHALGFNRAAILLVDEEADELVAQMAVGPASAEEASRIWKEISERHPELEEIIDSEPPSRESGLDRAVEGIRIRNDPGESLLAEALRDRGARRITQEEELKRLDARLRDELDFRNFVCVPLFTRNQDLGVIIADNRYSGSPITHEHVQILNMFSAQAAMAVSNAVTHTKLLESMEELREAQQKLIDQERLAVVGQMASHVAHEIRNPLVSIGLLSKNIARRHKDDQQTHFKATTIFEEVTRLEDILRSLMDYAGPKSSRRLELQEVDVNELVAETVKQFRQMMLSRDIRCKTQLHEELPPVRLDRRQIKQALINLLKNAIEAINREDGRVDMATCFDEEYVYVQLADNGPGMSEETVNKLFTPFFTTKRTGSGLGMAVIKKIIDEHDGQIHVDSELGRGTSFTVQLPIAGPAGKNSNEDEPAES